MAVSYWARWACNGQVADLPELLLLHVLAEGYELLTCDDGCQAFDRGGLTRKIGWSLSGGRWEHAPIDLTITYSYTDTRTVANFYWRLATRPLPASPKEQAGFATFLRQQVDRIITRLSLQVSAVPIQQDAEAAEEGAILQTCWELGQRTDTPPTQRIGRACADWHQALSTIDLAAERTETRQGVRAEPHTCNRCRGAAVPVPGTSGRYYCLPCRRHLPYVPAV